MSSCEECQSSFGCMNKASSCQKCQKILCSKCAGRNALIPFDPQNPAESNDLSKNDTVYTYCTPCFQEISTIDYSKKFDVVEPTNNSNGLTLVMVHGGGSTRMMFRPHARELAAMGYRCILPDLPGHGCLRDAPLTLDSCAETVQKVLQDENCDASKTIYVGASFGAYVGFYVLDQLKDKFAGAILMDCGQNVGPDCSLKARMGLFFMQYIGSAMSEEAILKAFLKTTKKSTADYHLVETCYSASMTLQNSKAQVEMLHTVSPAKHIPNFEFPVLYFNGSEDYRDSEDKWLKLCKDQERSSLHVYQGGDHFFCHDSRFVSDMLQRMDTFAKAATS